MMPDENNKYWNIIKMKNNKRLFCDKCWHITFSWKDKTSDNNPAELFTIDVNKPGKCRYPMFKKIVYDNFESKHDFYRSPDCMKPFMYRK